MEFLLQKISELAYNIVTTGLDAPRKIVNDSQQAIIKAKEVLIVTTFSVSLSSSLYTLSLSLRNNERADF